MHVLDPFAKQKSKDPFGDLMKNVKNLGLGSYMQPDDLTNIDKLKVLIKAAQQARE